MNNTRIVLLLLLVFLSIILAMIWHLSRLQSGLVNSTALSTATLYAEALTQFRTFYTSEVVTKAKRFGLDATHDYITREDAIPLPATLSMQLGEKIGKNTSGAKARLYSPYPFPWRRDASTKQFDKFAKDAWKFLSQNSKQPYFRFESRDSQTVLRFATADRMRPECIDCHNNHPESVKRDWKVGDLRGVLEITLPLDDINSQTEENLKNTSLAYVVIGVNITIAISIVIIGLRSQSSALEVRVADRTAKLQEEINERQRAMEALAELATRNRLLLNSAGEGIYGLDLDGKTTFVNPTACQMLRYTTKELLGQPMHSLVHHSYPDGSHYPRDDCPMCKASTDGEVHRMEGEVLWCKDGTRLPIEYTSTPIVQEGKLVGAVVIFNDVSERRKIERMKDEFVSTVSHELRTPLTSIKGNLGLLISGKLGELSENVQNMLNIAYSNSERLGLLINDLLDIDRMQTPESAFQMEATSMENLIKSAIESNQGYADKYGVELHWEHGDEKTVTVTGDENRLNQVMSNLLSNAIKYSPKGSVVKIVLGHDDDRVSIAISDQGPGIPYEFQDRVFEKFAQADSSDTRSVGGTGLGLAITKEIVEKHLGHIGFESTPGEGTTFYVELPIRKG